MPATSLADFCPYSPYSMFKIIAVGGRPAEIATTTTTIGDTDTTAVTGVGRDRDLATEIATTTDDELPREKCRT